MATYTKNWGPQHATMGRDSVHRINRAIEKRTRQEGKREAQVMATTLTHSDEVSGTTIFPDGTRTHWTEGRDSDVVVEHTDGSVEIIDGMDWHKYPYEAMDDHAEMREMTPEEEAHFNFMRGWEE